MVYSRIIRLVKHSLLMPLKMTRKEENDVDRCVGVHDRDEGKVSSAVPTSEFSCRDVLLHRDSGHSEWGSLFFVLVPINRHPRSSREVPADIRMADLDAEAVASAASPPSWEQAACDVD